MDLQLLPLVAFEIIQAIIVFIIVEQPLFKTIVAVLDIMYKFSLGD